MPKSAPKRQTFDVDQVWGDIRIRRTVRTKKMRNAYVTMLETLRGQGKKDFWEQIAKGDLKLEYLWELQKRKSLHRVISVESVLPARELMEAWVTDNPKLSAAAKKSYGDHISLLFKHWKGAAHVAELPAVLKHMQKVYERDSKATTFNRTRAIALSYISKTHHKYSPLWNELAAVSVLKRDWKKPNPHAEGEARSVVEMYRVCQAMKAPYGQYMWSMAVTGMSPTEYFDTGFTIYSDGLHIHGTKNEWRDRRIPIVDSSIVAPERSLQITRDHLHLVEPKWQIRDGRRSFQHWCESAGIDWTRSEIYAGHKPKNQQMVYTWHDTDIWRDGDAKLIRKFIQDSITNAPKEPVKVEPAPDLFGTLKDQ